MKLDNIIEEIILFFIILIAYPVMLFNSEMKKEDFENGKLK